MLNVIYILKKLLVYYLCRWWWRTTKDTQGETQRVTPSKRGTREREREREEGEQAESAGRENAVRVWRETRTRETRAIKAKC